MNLHIIRIKISFPKWTKTSRFSVEEFIKLLSKIGDSIRPEQMKKLFRKLDDDDSGDDSRRAAAVQEKEKKRARRGGDRPFGSSNKA